MDEAGVGAAVLGRLDDVLEVAQVAVAPLVERAEAGPGAALGVQLDGGHAQPDEARKERLFHVGELLEGHVLDDGR